MVPVLVLLSPLENRPLPWWDDPVARRAGRARDAALVSLVVVLGIAVLMVARSGLVGDGLVYLLIAAGGALGARCLALGIGPEARPRT